MQTPDTADKLDLVLEHVGVDEKARAMVRQFALEEFRRGYLHGLRDMKQQAENAIAGIRDKEV